MQAALARAVLLAPGAAWRSAAASTIREAAKTAGRSQPLASLLSFSAGTGSAAQLRPAITTTAAAGKAAAAAAAAAVTTAPAVLLRGGAWRAVSSAASAAAHQQSRGFARYLQFQTRGGGGGSGWGRWSEDSDKVLWGLIAANVGGFALWRLAPNLVRLPRRCWLQPSIAAFQHPACRCRHLAWAPRLGSRQRRQQCPLVSKPCGRLLLWCWGSPVPLRCPPPEPCPPFTGSPVLLRRCKRMPRSLSRACGRGGCGLPSPPPSATRTCTI